MNGHDANPFSIFNMRKVQRRAACIYYEINEQNEEEEEKKNFRKHSNFGCYLIKYSKFNFNAFGFNSPFSSIYFCSIF